jgi:hypothetical protein
MSPKLGSQACDDVLSIDWNRSSIVYFRVAAGRLSVPGLSTRGLVVETLDEAIKEARTLLEG